MTSNVIGNASSCSSNAKIPSRNVDFSCSSLCYGGGERASAMILHFLGR
jgi:hypothetical protein